MSKSIRTNLSYLRFSRGRLTQRAVSEATGVGQKTLSALETGASKGIEFNTLLRLCTFFHCEPGDLLVMEEEHQDEPASEEARRKAKDLVADGLRKVLKAPESTQQQVWDEFDAVRARMQTSAQRAPSQKASAKKGSVDQSCLR